MSWQRKAIGVAVAGIAGVTMMAGAAGGTSVTKQRIVIEGRLHLATGKGTFTLIPKGPGPLKRDAGPAVGGGTLKPPVIKANGQRVTVIIGRDSYSGKNGTFVITQRVESLTVHGFENARGTWTIKSGTGAYAGIRGGGGFAAAGLVNTGVLYSLQEGYVTKG